MRMKINKVKFGEFVAKRRAALPRISTQAKLAEKLSVAGGTIGKIENGERLPSFELFIDLADALLMTPGELIMVLAEREPGGKSYMEMNDWLFERLVKVMEDYQKVSEAYYGKPGGELPPENAQALAARNLALSRLQAEAEANKKAQQEKQEKQEEKQEQENPKIRSIHKLKNTSPDSKQ